MPSFYPENNQILPSDDCMRTLHKIASLNGAGSGGSSGSGSAGIQQVYMDRDPLPPDNPAFVAINARSDGGSWTTWNPATAAWA